MVAFASFADKLIIFLCCLAAYLFQGEFGASPSTVLISLSFSGFLSYFDNIKIRTVLTAGFSALSFFMPQLVVFLPLIVYDMLFYEYQYTNLVGIIPVINFAVNYSAPIVCVAAILLLLAALVRYRSATNMKLYLEYNDLRDAAKEMTIKLQRQNRELMENQDSELKFAALNERNRIAREIHDNVGHLLSSAILQVGAILAVNRDDRIKDNIKTLNSTLSQAMDSIRKSVHELYDEVGDLDSQIADIVNQFAFCDISYEYNIRATPGKKLKYAFVSIVKEALSNIMKHSNATHAFVKFAEHPAFYQLIVKDNGKVRGYSFENGLGLKNIIERVRSFGGHVNIATENGFEIFISIPKEGVKLEGIDRG